LSAERPELRLGRIIWAILEDFRGVPKLRPAIVLTPTTQLQPDEPFAVVAISTSYPEPPPQNHVELPWHPDRRRVQTRLNKRSAAVLTWLRAVREDEVEDFAGDVPPTLMREIQRRLKELDRT